MSRQVVFGQTHRGELKGNVPSLRGDHYDRIAITAYRGGDKFFFGGRPSGIAGNGIAARVVGTLASGELVCLKYSINPSKRTESCARVRQHQCDRYDFELWSLNARQIWCRKETCDWLLATDLD